MNPTTDPDPNAEKPRVASVDLLRSLIVVVMLVVNDLASVSGVPAWLKHISPPTADGMTLPDLVFPAFLFIVGLSLPLALERRLAGTTLLRVLGHVLVRTGSLLIMGVFMVNGESMSPDTPLGRAGWSLLVYAGMMLLWLAPRGARPFSRARWARQTAGGLILIVSALLYRGEEVAGWIQLRPHWWGILGLIGWAYLASAGIYLWLRRNLAAQVGMIGLLYCLYYADRAGLLAELRLLNGWINCGSMLGSHSAIALSGAVAGQLLLLSGEQPKPAQPLVRALTIGLMLGSAALLLHALREIHPMFIINKIAATPAWCLLSSALTVWIWAGVYLLTDVAGLGARPHLLVAAGRNALAAFILGPMVYAALSLLATWLGKEGVYDHVGTGFSLGLFRSLLFAIVVTGLTGWMWIRGWALRL